MNTCRTAYSLLTFLILAPCLLAQQTTICNFVELEPLKIAGNWGRLVAGDFNADGNMDVVSGTSTRFGVFLGVGDGTFVVGSETEILPSDSPYLQLSGITGLLQPGDLDGDGTLDLAVAVRNSDSGGDTLIDSRYCLNDGTGSFSQAFGPSLDNPYGFGSVAGAVRDFDNDGDGDIIWINQSSEFQGALWRSRNNGNGSFTTILEESLDSENRYSLRFSLADFNDDGFLDFAFPTSSADARVFRNNANGNVNFVGTSFDPTGGFSDSLGTAAGDIDGDGDIDLVFLHDNNSTSEMLQLINNGNGSFVLGPSVPGSLGAEDLASADFNGDSLGDLLAFYPDSFKLLINQGDDDFSIAAEVFTNGSTSIIEDFNGDGQLDVAVLNLADGNTFITVYALEICTLLGDLNGDGAVTLLDVQPFVDALISGRFVSTADINQDGRLNLLDVQSFVSILTGE